MDLHHRLKPYQDSTLLLSYTPAKNIITTCYILSNTLKWSERRVTLPLNLAPEASASLLGYVLENHGDFTRDNYSQFGFRLLRTY